jgi:hypothetical protein
MCNRALELSAVCIFSCVLLDFSHFFSLTKSHVPTALIKRFTGVDKVTKQTVARSKLRPLVSPGLAAAGSGMDQK